MNDSEIKKILLERACREIDSLGNAEQYYQGDVKVQRLAYADQLILLLNDFNKQLCSIEIKGVINILNQLYCRVRDGIPFPDDIQQFMTAFYKAKRKSVVFPSVDIIRNAVRIVMERWAEEHIEQPEI